MLIVDRYGAMLGGMLALLANSLNVALDIGPRFLVPILMRANPHRTCATPRGCETGVTPLMLKRNDVDFVFRHLEAHPFFLAWDTSGGRGWDDMRPGHRAILAAELVGVLGRIGPLR
ncbi:MAG TPA: hypothetical protein VF060_21520 [Trebonia sp.]